MDKVARRRGAIRFGASDDEPDHVYHLAEWQRPGVVLGLAPLNQGASRRQCRIRLWPLLGGAQGDGLDRERDRVCARAV